MSLSVAVPAGGIQELEQYRAAIAMSGAPLARISACGHRDPRPVGAARQVVSSFAVATFLDAEEIAALLAVPDRMTWAGRRDLALLLLAIQTGLRASELVNLRAAT
jgi:integrase